MATGKTKKSSTNTEATAMSERELVISRVFDAPRPLVFEAWTNPEHLVHWWGPNGFTLPSCKLDLRVGGVFRFVMRSPEGTVHRVQGVYREIVEPERIICTWAWVDEEGKPGHETTLTVTFAEHGKKTKLTLYQTIFESVEARDAHQHGWTETLDRLAVYAANI